MVFTSSVAGSLGLVNHEAIAAAKGGVESMVRSAAATYAKRGIRVNAVCTRPYRYEVSSNGFALRCD